MDKIIYGFILYVVYLTLNESCLQFMFTTYSGENHVGAAGSIRNFDPDQNSLRALSDSNSVKYEANITDALIHFGDLVFNEVMADPVPVVKLPNAEFIELKNVSGFPIDIKSWILDMNGRQKILPDQLIQADSFLILSGTGGSAVWGAYGANIEIPGLTLANAGFSLKLFSAARVLIDSLDYTPAMHRAGFKDGGYSLERIDPRRWCGPESNWETTISEAGGTPGSENSVFGNNPDAKPPDVLSIGVPNPDLLEVIVSERPDRTSLSGSVFSCVPALPLPDSVRFDYLLNKYSIYFPHGSMASGVYYELISKGLTDECGNIAPIDHHEFWFYLPKPGDLLISEVLFNPLPGGVDFVEIFNHSGFKIHLEDLFLATMDNANKIKSLYPLSTLADVLPDGGFAAFTSNSAILLTNYNSLCPDCIFGMAKFPTYNLDEGLVVLVNREMTIIDQFHYLEQMHDPLLNDVKGVSLERISFSKPAGDRQNWHSASATVGFATPGYRNSAAEIATGKRAVVTVKPRIFSPNGDGLNDRLLINLSPGEPGWTANIRIFNENGSEIRRLANNLSVGSQDSMEWDGTTENHQKAGLGIYIISVDLFNLKNGASHFKTACVLTDRLE